MAALGGYFAVSYLARQAVVSALDAVWRVGWNQAARPASWGADTAVGRLEASGVASVGKPHLTLNAAANAFHLRLNGNARFDVRLGGLAAGGVFVGVTAEIDLPVRVSQDGAFRKAEVDFTGFTLQTTELGLTGFDGPLDGRVETAMLSDGARAELTRLLVERWGRFLKFQLPTDQLWLAEMTAMTQGVPGSVIILPQVTLGAVRILDDWVAIGIDSTGADADTHGNPFGIGPPPEAPPAPPQSGLQADDEGDGTLRLLIDPNVLHAFLAINAKLALIVQTASHPNIHPDPDVGIEFDNDALVVHPTGMSTRPIPSPDRSGSPPTSASTRSSPATATPSTPRSARR